VNRTLKVYEIRDFREFEELREFWNQILQKALDNDVFSTWEWLWCWWKYFGTERELRILTVKEGDHIIAIAPFMLSNYNFLNIGKLSKIEFMSCPYGDYNNFILLKRESECLKLFLETLMGFSDWDLLDLRDIPEGNSLPKISDSFCSFGKLRFDMKVRTVCPYIRLPTSTEAFEKRMSRNMRRNLRKRMRRLKKLYKVEVITQREFGSVTRAMETFFRLHQKKWESEGKPGAFIDENFRRFHKDLARIFDEKGWLDLHFLTVDGEPVAAAYTFDYNFKKYGYLTGFDPEFRRFGVGNLLKMYIIQECINRGFREYDLTRDFEPYKADWATNVRRNYVIRFVKGGAFANLYSRFADSNFSSFLYDKFGMHLSI